MLHQTAINDCHQRLRETLEELKKDQKVIDARNWPIDHFGFVTSRHFYLSERQAFARLIQKPQSYAVDGGFLTVGSQAPNSNLRWGGQRLSGLVLVGNEALGMGVGYVAVTVDKLDPVAYSLWQCQIDFNWGALFCQRCVVTSLRGQYSQTGGIGPEYRIYFFEKGLGQLVSGLKPISF